MLRIRLKCFRSNFSRCNVRNAHKFQPLQTKVLEENIKVASLGNWIGRIKTKDGAYRVVSVVDGTVFDITSAGVPTVAHLLQNRNVLEVFKSATKKGKRIDSFKELLTNSLNQNSTHLISPHDLSAVKAAGVVFIKSLLERVVEEQAKGDANKALSIRNEINSAIGTQMNDVKPGSEQALQLLQYLIKQKGLSHHYLEVGLGVDAELFTKSQAMSSIGFGAQLGIHPRSTWNNPEPELVIVANRFGEIIGCCLGNDVNLRDFEGRSALLLGKAKDNNGSCVLGPLVRLFDESFSLSDARSAEITLAVYGEKDDFILHGRSSLSEIGRDITDLMKQAFTAHQYPDGVFMMTGTMFAPVEDRDINHKGSGFTHKMGDAVYISSPKLGALWNIVNDSTKIPKWEFGSVDLLNQLLKGSN